MVRKRTEYSTSPTVTSHASSNHFIKLKEALHLAISLDYFSFQISHFSLIHITNQMFFFRLHLQKCSSRGSLISHNLIFLLREKGNAGPGIFAHKKKENAQQLRKCCLWNKSNATSDLILKKAQKSF